MKCLHENIGGMKEREVPIIPLLQTVFNESQEIAAHVKSISKGEVQAALCCLVCSSEIKL